MAAKPKITPSQTTVFHCLAPDARAVFLAGSFNEWNPQATPMVKAADGIWSASLDLPPGRYEFKFVVDGVWRCEPGCEGRSEGNKDCVPNSFGTMNHVTEVAPR